MLSDLYSIELQVKSQDIILDRHGDIPKMSIELHSRTVSRKMKGGAGTPPEIAVKED